MSYCVITNLLQGSLHAGVPIAMFFNAAQFDRTIEQFVNAVNVNIHILCDGSCIILGSKSYIF